MVTGPRGPPKMTGAEHTSMTRPGLQEAGTRVASRELQPAPGRKQGAGRRFAARMARERKRSSTAAGIVRVVGRFVRQNDGSGQTASQRDGPVGRGRSENTTMKAITR